MEREVCIDREERDSHIGRGMEKRSEEGRRERERGGELEKDGEVERVSKIERVR